MFALIANGTVAQVAAVTFPVAEPLEWVECSTTPGVAPGWLYDGALFTAPAAPPPPAPTTQISPLQFIARFTPAETAAISAAALGNAAMLMWLVQASAASFIDLADPRTKAGLDSMVGAGLLTAAREAEILAP